MMDDAMLPDARPPRPVGPRAAPAGPSTLGAWLLLVAVLLPALALRLHGLTWDDGYQLHPDERFIVSVAEALRLPSGPAEYFDTERSPLNPYNYQIAGFAYGTLPVFLLRGLATAVGASDQVSLTMLGRGLAVAADLGSVLLVFALGRLLYGAWVGLAGAAILGASVLNVQLAHFFAVDPFATFFLTWSLLCAHLAWMRGGWPYAVGAGLGLGLAAACKISALLFGPVLLLGCLLPWPDRGWSAIGAVRRLALAGLATFGAYRLAEPYAFVGPGPLGLALNPTFLVDMAYWVAVSSGEIPVPYMFQWTDTPPYLFVVDGIVRWGLGPAAAAAAGLGLLLTVAGARRWASGRRHMLLLAWMVVGLGYFGAQFAKFMRYVLPLYPVLALLAAYGLWRCWLAGARLSRAGGPNRLWGRALAGAPAVVIGLTALWAAAFSAIYREPNTRVTASHWIRENVPDGSVLAIEHWDDPLPLPLAGLPEKPLRLITLKLYDEDTLEKRRELLGALDRAGYVVLASNRLAGSIPRLPERYPLTTEYYRALFDGRLGFELAAEFSARPRLLGLEIADDGAQEDFRVYDHPHVRIFRRGAAYDPSRAASLLDPELLSGPLAGSSPPPAAPDHWPDVAFDAGSAPLPLRAGGAMTSASTNP